MPQISAILQRGRATRNLVLAEIGAATPEEMTKRPGNRWSAREVLIHIGNWEEEGVAMLTHLVKGEQPPQREPKPINELNAEMMARYDHLDAAGAVAYMQRVRAEFEQLGAQITVDQWKANPIFLGVMQIAPDHESGHLHQLREALAAARGEAAEAAVHSLRYTRQRVLNRLMMEFRPGDAFTWRPADGSWTVKESLIHLAVWDRFAAGVFAAIAEGRPVPGDPFPEGALDAWNREQVDAGAWMSLADVLHDLGGAREALEHQVRRLTPAQVASPEAQTWLGYRDHDNHHMNAIQSKLQAWRKATA